MRALLPTARREYWTTWFSALLFFAAFYILLVPLPLYLAQIRLPDWQIGVILGAFGVASLVGRPLTGLLTDRWGYRVVILAGTLSLAVGAAGVPMTASPAAQFLLRILQAGGYIAFTTAATALIADLAPKDRQGAAMAIFGMAANVAMTLVPVAISAALGWLSIPNALRLCALLAAVAGLLIWRTAVTSQSQPAPVPWRGMFDFPPLLRWPMIATVLFGASFGVFFQFLPLLAERRGIEPVGLAYTVYGLGIIATRLSTGRLLDGPHRGRILALAALVLAGGLLGFSQAHAMLGLLAAALLVAFGSGILHPALIALHVELSPASQRGRATAAFYLAFDLGIGMGSWLLSPVLQRFGLAGLFLMAGTIALVTLWPLARLPRPQLAAGSASGGSTPT